jgi:hypothetical protein
VQQLTLLVACCVVLPAHAQHPVPAPDRDEIAVREAAKRAPIHAIGVSTPKIHSVFADDLADAQKLAEGLRKSNGPGHRFHQFLSDDVKLKLQDDKLVAGLNNQRMSQDATTLRLGMLHDLTKMLVQPGVYTEKAFEGVELGKEAQALIALGEKRTIHQTARLNRYLFAVGLPDGLKPPPPGFLRVRVQVVGEGETILVLTCHTLCEWDVKVDKGAKVGGVILGGYAYQSVRGIDAPIVRRVRTASDGNRIERLDYLDCWKMKGDDYAKYAAAVKKIVGHELTSFHGEYSPKEEPIIVRLGGQ